MSPNPYAPPKAPLDDVSPTTDTAPALWNPNAAASWSLFLSPIFGAALHMKNWQALGETQKAEESRRWLLACVALFAVLMVATFILPDTRAMDLGFRAVAFGLLIAWYSLSARPQARYIAGRFGTSYPRKGWGKPLLYAFLCLVGFFVVVFVVAFIAGFASGAG